jgi:hypothetical protein
VSVVIPRYVNEIILRTERDELVGGEKCALHESTFEAAVPTNEALLHSRVRLTRDANNRNDQQVPHTSNEIELSRGYGERG